MISQDLMAAAAPRTRPKTKFQLAIDDIVRGVTSVHIWPMLGWQEIKQRYRRSFLGPFWLTISAGIMIGVMGPLYGKLFGQDITTYFPYLAVGLVLWQLISQMLIDSCQAFIAAEGYIKQVRLPYSVYILRVVWKNLIIFLHNMVIVIPVVAYFRPTLDANLLLLPFALLLITLNGLWVGLVLGLVCARYRDIPQIVTNLVQVAFFVTPVMWFPQMLGRHQWANNLNPLYHFIEIARAPLLGSPMSATSWLAAACITVAGFAITVVFFARYRGRIAYWV